MSFFVFFSEITEFPPFTSMFNDPSQSDSTNEMQHTRLTDFPTSFRGSTHEERELVSIQSAMSLPGSFGTSRCGGAMTFPYDNPPAQTNAMYPGNTFEYAIREQRMLEESPYMDDRGRGHLYHPYKHCVEYSGQGTNGLFLTQELERLHMAYGTENLFDRNYLFQRELRT